jgi:arylformamidase
LTYVTENAPPFLLAYGTEDFPHLRVQADTIETAMAKQGCDVEKIVFDGRDHFGASLAGGEPDGPWVSRALDWMTAR